MRGLSCLGLCWALFAAAPAPAAARKQQDFAYRFEDVWSASVRMVRVDLRFPVRDQDPSIGYLLFEYQDRGRAHPGSIELVRFAERGQDKVKVVVQIPAMPTYIEQMMLDRLARKLLEELGEPPPPPRRPEPAPPAEDPPADDDGEGDGEPPSDDERPREPNRPRR